MTASARAGIDLEAIKDEDVRITDTSIEINFRNRKFSSWTSSRTTQKLYEIIAPCGARTTRSRKTKYWLKESTTSRRSLPTGNRAS